MDNELKGLNELHGQPGESDEDCRGLGESVRVFPVFGTHELSELQGKLDELAKEFTAANIRNLMSHSSDSASWRAMQGTRRVAEGTR